MYFGKAIQYFREQSQLSQVELAEKAGISSSSVSQYEKGGRNPSKDSIEAIAKVLGVSVEDIRAHANRLKELAKMGEFTDYDRYQRLLSSIDRNSDFTMELTKDIILSFRLRVHDLLYESRNGGNASNWGQLRDRRVSPVTSITEKVLLDFISENFYDIADRIREEMNRTNKTVEEIVRNLK